MYEQIQLPNAITNALKQSILIFFNIGQIYIFTLTLTIKINEH